MFRFDSLSGGDLINLLIDGSRSWIKTLGQLIQQLIMGLLVSVEVDGQVSRDIPHLVEISLSLLPESPDAMSSLLGCRVLNVLL
jgi:hypothetical protein